MCIDRLSMNGVGYMHETRGRLGKATMAYMSSSSCKTKGRFSIMIAFVEDNLPSLDFCSLSFSVFTMEEKRKSKRKGLWSWYWSQVGGPFGPGGQQCRGFLSGRVRVFMRSWTEKD